MAKGNIKTKGHLEGTDPEIDINKLKQTAAEQKLTSKIENKMKPKGMPMQGTPFKLGSNRESSPYTALQAKGLISPMENKEEKKKKTDNLQDNYQNYTDQDMKEGKVRAGKAAAIAAAKAGKTKFKYGNSSYTIPQDILATYGQ